MKSALETNFIITDTQARLVQEQPSIKILFLITLILQHVYLVMMIIISLLAAKLLIKKVVALVVQTQIKRILAFLPHKHNNIDAKFIQITTKTDEFSIKLSSTHLIPISVDCIKSKISLNLLVQASEVHVDNCVYTTKGLKKIKSIKTIEEQGIYTLITNQEFIVVNNIIASPFVVNHYIANKYYNFHRMIYYYASSVIKTKFYSLVNSLANRIADLYTSS
jgi:hypothetical protein